MNGMLISASCTVCNVKGWRSSKIAVLMSGDCGAGRLIMTELKKAGCVVNL